jgi:hypothetical protein
MGTVLCSHRFEYNHPSANCVIFYMVGLVKRSETVIVDSPG